VAVLGILAQLGCFDPLAAAGQIPISGMSPYSDGGDPNDPLAVTACNGGPQIGVVYRNCETEPHLAVNPTDPQNMIACWHQDRWSNGSAQGVMSAYTRDGGTTWTQVMIPFTHCAGGEPGSAGDYERASDPWLSFGPDGAVYYMALVSNRSTSRNGMVMAKSVDGGATWAEPVTIKDHDARGWRSRSLFNDKNTITADPYNPNLVYATWNVFRNGNTAQVFSRSIDGGLTWGATRPVNKQDHVAPHTRVYFRQGAQIVVLPDGTLLNVFYRYLLDPRGGGALVGVDQALYRSFDQGKHWERLDTTVAEIMPFVAVDLELELPVRDGGALPDIAVNRQNGYLYVVWQDVRFNPYQLVGAVISMSTDGGNSWSDPIPVNQIAPSHVQAFLPTVAVAADGTVGVLFYDFRHDSPGDATLDTDVYVAMFDAELNHQGEERLTESPFDMRQMLLTGYRGYFPGDYVGFAAAGNDFVAAFTAANNLGLPVDFPQNPWELRVDNHNRQDILFARVSRGGSGKPTPGMFPQAPGQPSIHSKAALVASDYTLGNAPNPFNPHTVIQFHLPRPEAVELQIFDVAGRLVRTLVAGEKYTAGPHVITWNGCNDLGQAAASGVYLYRLQTKDFSVTKKMMLME
jgi:hypothetical protein